MEFMSYIGGVFTILRNCIVVLQLKENYHFSYQPEVYEGSSSSEFSNLILYWSSVIFILDILIDM